MSDNLFPAVSVTVLMPLLRRFVSSGEAVNLVPLFGPQTNLSAGAVSCSRCYRPSLSGVCTAICAPIAVQCSAPGFQSSLQVHPSTCNIFFVGTETEGSPNATVRITDMSSSLSTTVSVAISTAVNFSIGANPGVVHPVRDWFGGSGCRQLYQSTKIATTIGIARSGTIVSEFYDVTFRAANRLVVTTPTIGAFDLVQGAPFFTGVSAGAALVSLVGPSGATLASTVVTVTNSEVSVLSFDVHTARSVVIQAPQDQSRALPHSSATAVAVVNSPTTLVNGEQALSVAAGGLLHLVFRAFTTDGRNQVVTSPMGVSAVSMNTAVLSSIASDVASAVVGSTSGSASLNVTWVSQCTGNLVFASNLSLATAVELPVDIQVTLGANRLAPENDPAVRLGIPSSTTISVHLVYADGTRLDVTSDSGTQYVLSSDNAGMVSVFKSVGLVRTNSAGICGSANVSVIIQGVPTILSNLLPGNRQQFTVACISSLLVTSVPEPSYAGSTSFNEVVLSQVGNTSVYQQSRLITLASFTDSSQTVDVSANTALSYTVFQAGTSTVSSTLAVSASTAIVTAFSAGIVDVVVAFPATPTLRAVSSGRVQISVTDTPLSVLSVLLHNPFTTLRGTVGTSSTMQVFVILADSTQLPHSALFTSALVPIYPGLLAFSLSATVDGSVPVAVDGTNGRVTLLSNHHQLVSIVASAIPSSSAQAAATLAFACNLDPLVGDIDVGNPTGLPIDPISTTSSTTLPVRVNTGTSNLGPFTVVLDYSSSCQRLFNVTSISVGSSMQQGGGTNSLLFVVSRAAGTITVTSEGPIAAGEQGANYEIFVVHIQALSVVGTCTVGGTVARLVEHDISAAAITIGAATPRLIVTGINQVSVVSGTSTTTRRAVLDGMVGTELPEGALVSSHDDPRRHRSRRAVCVGSRPSGDTNGDCAFDIVDAAFTSLYVVEALVGFTGTFGTAFQNRMALPEWAEMFANLDSNRDSIIDALDSLFLARTSIGMTHFRTSNITLSPTNETDGTGCVMSFRVSLTAASGSPPAIGTTLVWFDIASTSVNLRSRLDSSLDNCTTCLGSLERAAFHTGTPGMLLRAVQGTGGQFLASIQTDAIFADVGLLGVSVVVATIPEEGLTTDLRLEMFAGPPRLVRLPEYPATTAITVPTSSSTSLTINRQGYSPLAQTRNDVRGTDCRNDHIPVFSSAHYNFSVQETTAVGSVVGTVLATDADVGPGRAVVYSVVTQSTSPVLFALNNLSGEVTLVRSLLTGLAFENASMVVMATDTQPPFRTTTAVVLLSIERRPEFLPPIAGLASTFSAATETNLSAFYSVASPSSGDAGSVVLQLSARARDGNASGITFTLLHDALNGSYSFNAISATFVKETRVWRTNASVFVATVRISDSAGRSADAVVHILQDSAAHYLRVDDVITGSGAGLAVTGFGEPIDTTTPYTGSPRVPSFGTTAALEAYSTVHSEGFRFDRTAVRVGVRVFNNVSTAVMASQFRVTCVVTPQASLVAALTLAGVSTSSVSAQCTTDTTRGRCMTSSAIPAAWFDAISTAVDVQLTCSTLGIAPVVVPGGPFFVHPKRSPSIFRQVVVKTPHAGVTLNTIFEARVEANAE